MMSTQGPSSPAAANFKIHCTPHPRSKNRSQNTRHALGTPSFAPVPDRIFQHFENAAHREFELDEVNPKLGMFERARLIVGVADCCSIQVDLVEFDNRLPNRRTDPTAIPLFNLPDALAQRVLELHHFANDLEVQLKRVTIREQDGVTPVERLAAFECGPKKRICALLVAACKLQITVYAAAIQ